MYIYVVEIRIHFYHMPYSFLSFLFFPSRNTLNWVNLTAYTQGERKRENLAAVAPAFMILLQQQLKKPETSEFSSLRRSRDRSFGTVRLEPPGCQISILIVLFVIKLSLWKIAFSTENSKFFLIFWTGFKSVAAKTPGIQIIPMPKLAS